MTQKTTLCGHCNKELVRPNEVHSRTLCEGESFLASCSEECAALLRLRIGKPVAWRPKVLKFPAASSKYALA